MRWSLQETRGHPREEKGPETPMMHLIYPFRSAPIGALFNYQNFKKVQRLRCFKTSGCRERNAREILHLPSAFQQFLSQSPIWKDGAWVVCCLCNSYFKGKHIQKLKILLTLNNGGWGELTPTIKNPHITLIFSSLTTNSLLWARNLLDNIVI